MAPQQIDAFAGLDLGVKERRTPWPDGQKAQREFTRTHAQARGQKTSKQAARDKARGEAMGPALYRGAPNGTLRVLLALEHLGGLTPDGYYGATGREEHQRFADALALGYIIQSGVATSRRGKPMDAYRLTDKGRTKLTSIRTKVPGLAHAGGAGGA